MLIMCIYALVSMNGSVMVYVCVYNVDMFCGLNDLLSFLFISLLLTGTQSISLNDNEKKVKNSASYFSWELKHSQVPKNILCGKTQKPSQATQHSLNHSFEMCFEM